MTAALLVGQATAHPHLTREQAIQVAMRYGNRQSYPRVEARYMHYGDFARANSGIRISVDHADRFVWVVAASGRYGITPLGLATWGIAVVPDEWGVTNGIIFESGVSGDWPPFFDGLPDLSAK